MDTIKRLIADERGLESVEYVVVGSLVVLAAIVAITGLGTKVKDAFQKLNDKIVLPA